MGEPANASQRRRAREQARRSDTADPHHARARALKILFQADVRGVTPDVTLDRLDRDASARAILDDAEGLAQEQDLLANEEQRPKRRPATRGTASAPEHDVAAPIDDFTRTLVRGVAEHRDELDALITRFARRWQISRMPVVDRTVLRLATYELLHEPTPPAVVIDEAVTLAASLSTDDSGRYVNGVLESVRKDLAARQGPDGTDT